MWGRKTRPLLEGTQIIAVIAREVPINTLVLNWLGDNWEKDIGLFTVSGFY